MFGRFLSVFFLAFFLFQAQATAGSPKEHTFSVLPFALHGPQNWRYLQEAIPEILSSRLTWPGHFTSVSNRKAGAKPADISAEAADEQRKNLKVDYLIWGTLSIIGENCSLDIQTVNPRGEKKPFSSSCKVKELIPHLEEVARVLNSAIFSRPPIRTELPEKPAPIQSGQPLIHGRTQSGFSPGLRDVADPHNGQSWRAQALNFPSRGMLVGDADGNGEKEFFFLKERSVAVYHLKENRLVPVDEFSLSLRYECLNINFLPSANSTQKIVVSATTKGRPGSCILSFADGKLKPEHENLPYFLNVIKEPPLYIPVLFGQKKGISRFLDNGIVELTISQQDVFPGRTLKLPEHGNIFNIVFLPEKDGHKLLVADRFDKLRVFSSDHKLLATTDETYAASGTGIEYDTTFAGGRPNDSDNIKNYFIPTRLDAFNIDNDQNHELLVAHNISGAARFSHRYRNFSQSEIHYLAWDGIGLNTVWKTQRIKGSTIDYTITDLNGQKTLLVCINTHPGSLGMREKKTIVLGYPIGKNF